MGFIADPSDRDVTIPTLKIRLMAIGIFWIGPSHSPLVSRYRIVVNFAWAAGTRRLSVEKTRYNRLEASF